MTDYKSFLKSKHVGIIENGFDVPIESINPKLFDWQREIVKWALRLGKAALFEECGLGKTPQQAEWSRHVATYTGRKVIILAPLAVAHQTVAEGRKFDVPITYCRSQGEAELCDSRVIVANYEMLSHFNPDYFGGVVLDESSILKAYSGTTRKMIQSAFTNTPFKLCCTATPAPNDHMELGNHAEFLNIMRGTEMLSRWFINDTMSAGHYRLKGHAEADFWKWIAQWAVCISKPSDIGYLDDGFALPPLNIHSSSVKVDHTRAHAQGMLFLSGNLSATNMWHEKAATAEERCQRAADIVATDTKLPWIVWCDTNDEADRLKDLLPEAVEVRGSDSPVAKENKLNSFTDGRKRIIITKADIAGFGLNWQHCSNTVFVGVTYSFEKLYQALRRLYRFGQTRPVEAYLIYAESEGNILETVKHKQADHAKMQQAMNLATQAVGKVGLNPHRVIEAYAPKVRMRVPSWATTHTHREILE